MNIDFSIEELFGLLLSLNTSIVKYELDECDTKSSYEKQTLRESLEMFYNLDDKIRAEMGVTNSVQFHSAIHLKLREMRGYDVVRVRCFDGEKIDEVKGE